MAKNDAISEIKQRCKSFADMSSDWYWELNDQFKFKRFAADMSLLEGTTSEMHYGRTDSNLLMPDKERMSWSNHKDLLMRHEPFREFEHERLSDNGAVVWLSSSGDPVFNADNKFTGYRGVCRIITAQKQIEIAHMQNEERLRLSVNMSGIGIWEWDMISDSVVWDKRQFELFGLPEVEGPISLSSITNVIHPDDRDRLNEAARRVLEQGESAAEEFRVIHDDGSVRWLLGSSGIVDFSNNKENALLVGVNLDITESKRIEISLRDNEKNLKTVNTILEFKIKERTRELRSEAKRHVITQSELVASQRLKSIGQMVGGIAHDYNNMFAIIGGNLELALLDKDQAESREYISKSLTAVYSGVSLNRRLLTFSRNTHREPTNLSLNAQLSEIAGLLERTLGEKISITTIADADSWVVYADQGEVDSALINLSINARDAMPDGGQLRFEICNSTLSEKDLEARPNVNPGDYVALIVTDDGVGMSDTVLQQAIDPFFTTKQQGTGMGLSSIFEFSKQSGGFLSIDSHVGIGTTVSIYLPRVFSEPDLPKADTEITISNMSLDTGNELILIVEDDAMLRDLTVLRLKNIGYRVIQAATGREAVDLLEGDFDVKLVFSDIVMPGDMTGFDLAHWLAGHKPMIKVLLTSGYFDHELVNADQQSAISIPVLEKPYEMHCLASKIRMILDE